MNKTTYLSDGNTAISVKETSEVDYKSYVETINGFTNTARFEHNSAEQYVAEKIKDGYIEISLEEFKQLAIYNLNEQIRLIKNLK